MLTSTVPGARHRSSAAGFSNHILRGVSRGSLICCFLALAAARSQAQVSVLTQHNDNARTGQNLSETILNTSNVNTSQFGKLFSHPVTGQIYAQPLYVANVSIAGGTHNVLIVATEEDMVYAYDADSNTGANAVPLWSANLAPTGETALHSQLTIGCTDMQPYIGISSTPVIDSVSQTIYVEAKTTNGSGTYFHRLHALSLLTGAEKSPGPVVITATVEGSGDGSQGGSITFDNLHQLNRPGLLLLNDAIYLAYASHCDYYPYHGWIFAYDEATLTRKSLLVTSPNGGFGGFWMAGSGVAADSNGYIYIASGNGDFNNMTSPLELGDTLMKLSTTSENLSLFDYFTPSDQSCLATDDNDLGSGGVLLLPDQPGTYPHIMVQAGKEGMVYVVNRDQLTSNNSHYNGVDTCMSTDPEIIEESPSVGGMWSMPAYWNNNIYFWGSYDVLKSVPIVNGLPDFAELTSNSVNLDFPGATPSISSNGTTTGSAILWAIDSTQYGRPGPGPGPAVLHAFDATKISTELWNSSQASGARDKAGNAVKFAVPTIANGKVYVGTSSEVDVYGLLGGGIQQTATPVITPGTETSATAVRVRITDSTSGASVYYTTDGTTPSTSSTKFTSPFTLSSSATVKAVAQASGDSLSNVASVTYTITTVQPPVAPQFSPPAGTYAGSVTVTITDSTSGTTIYFTTDGSKPSPGEGTTQQYSGPLTFTKTTGLEAIATVGSSTSAVASGAYRITP